MINNFLLYSINIFVMTVPNHISTSPSTYAKLRTKDIARRIYLGAKLVFFRYIHV